MNRVIITGANGNLGSATVKKFLESGYYVIAVDAKNDHLNFASGNSHFEFHSVNLADEKETAAFVTSLVKNHTIHAALMLVGGFAAGNMADADGTAVKQQITLNFETAYYMARPLTLHMQEHGYGRLVFVGARPAIKPEQGKNLVAYSLAKSLLFKLAEFINEENKGKNIVASVIVPSTIDTELNRKSMPDANPDNWIKAEQIAEVLEFICSSAGIALREPIYKLYNNA